MIRSIAHPTDLSAESMPAFEHALRLALLNRCEFIVVHAREPGEATHWDSFPRVRETMARWGFIDPEARRGDVLGRTGVSVQKVEIGAHDVVNGLAEFLQSQTTDLLVMASRGRAGLNALFNASMSAKLAQVSMLATLIFGPRARSFVDPETGGHEAIKRVLVPVDHDPPARAALHRLDALAEGLNVTFDHIHVGGEAPVLVGNRGPQQVRTLQGPVVETILAEAESVDLVAMPIAGRRSLLDALRGSTTERVIRDATRPVLAVPA